MPWIHWKDVVGVYAYALEHTLSGAYNVGVGQAPTQKTLFKTFGKKIHAPFVWRIPYFIGKLILGEFAASLVSSQNTISTKLTATGYTHTVTSLEDACADVA